MRIHSKGFTLIELLVVVSIIAMLASVVLASLINARNSARDAQRKSDLHQIQVALESYYNTYGGYPSSACPAIDYKIINSIAQQSNFSKFLTSVPHDPAQGPSGGNAYNNEYLYISDVYNDNNGNTNNNCNGSGNTSHFASVYTIYATLSNQSTNNLSSSNNADNWLLTGAGGQATPPPTVNYKLCSLAGCR